MRYIIYARKSTEDDNHQVLSIESQLAELREFAVKEKLEIVKERGEALNFLDFCVAPSEARDENRPS